MPFPPVPRLYITKDLTDSPALIDTNFKNIINYLERLKDSTRDTVEDIVMTSEAGIGITAINTLDSRHQFLTRVNDTNVTLVIASAIDTHQFTVGWIGTLAASRLNANVVHAVADDTNITGVIAAQVLTLGWAGTLSAARLNSTVVQAVVNDTNFTGSITAQALTLGFTGTLNGARGGTGIANTGFTITLAGNVSTAGAFTTTGAFNTTLVQAATVSLTLPLVSSTLLANNLGLVGNTTLIGGTTASGTLTLQSTSHGTKGLIAFGTSVYDEVNNRLGIGTAIPDAPLHTAAQLGALAYSPTTYQGNNDAMFTVPSGANYFSQTRYAGGSGSGEAFFGVTQATGNGLDFFWKTYNGSAFGERMRLTTAGKVGIGVLAPTEALDVSGIIRSLIGVSSGTITNIGVADIQTSSAGTGNAADTTDDTLFTYSLPLNAMSANGKSLRVISTGHFATNGNNKQVKFWFAGTTIIDSTVLAASDTDWDCEINITRIDSTHVSCHGRFYCPGSGAPDVITATPNLAVADLTANASIVKITGASTVTAAANDILAYLMKTWFEN